LFLLPLPYLFSEAYPPSLLTCVQVGVPSSVRTSVVKGQTEFCSLLYLSGSSYATDSNNCQKWHLPLNYNNLFQDSRWSN
jgi:hypothetical protein